MFAEEGRGANGGQRMIGFVLRGRVDWVKEGHCLCLLRLHRGGMRRQEAIKLHCTERTIGFSWMYQQLRSSILNQDGMFEKGVVTCWICEKRWEGALHHFGRGRTRFFEIEALHQARFFCTLAGIAGNIEKRKRNKQGIWQRKSPRGRIVEGILNVLIWH